LEGRGVVGAQVRRNGAGCGVYRLHGAFGEGVSLGVEPYNSVLEKIHASTLPSPLATCLDSAISCHAGMRTAARRAFCGHHVCHPRC
jgi:hypothetical protein